jgi:hypothetical protein
LGRASKRRAPEAELDRMHRLYREEYADFTTKHFHEELVRRHNYKLGYTVTRLSLQAAGMVAKVDKTRPTQVGRALAQLGIRHIPSYSPEARGRMERAFGALQGRLPQALRVAGITSVAATNAYLRDVYVPEHNARFGKPASEPGTAFVPYIGVGLAEVLCVQEDRQVGRDNCVSWEGKSLQIPLQTHRQHWD